MEFKVLSIVEMGQSLRIKVESEFGIDNIGLSINAKYKDPFTGKFMWQNEVKELLEKKYPLNKDNIVEKKEILKEFKNRRFNLENFNKTSPEDVKVELPTLEEVQAKKKELSWQEFVAWAEDYGIKAKSEKEAVELFKQKINAAEL